MVDAVTSAARFSWKIIRWPSDNDANYYQCVNHYHVIRYVYCKCTCIDACTDFNLQYLYTKFTPDNLTPRAPSARYVACEWRCAGAVGEITRRAETPVVSPSATNLNQHWPAVPCHGKFHLPRSPMSGCKTSCHEITAEISVAIFSVYQKFVGFAILVEN